MLMSRVQKTPNGGAVLLKKLVDAADSYNLNCFDTSGVATAELKKLANWITWESAWEEAREFIAQGDLTQSCMGIIRRLIIANELCAEELDYDDVEVSEQTAAAMDVYESCWSEMVAWAKTYNVVR
jgi:hypothetical protein